MQRKKTYPEEVGGRLKLLASFLPNHTPSKISVITGFFLYYNNGINTNKTIAPHLRPKKGGADGRNRLKFNFIRCIAQKEVSRC